MKIWWLSCTIFYNLRYFVSYPMPNFASSKNHLADLDHMTKISECLQKSDLNAFVIIVGMTLKSLIFWRRPQKVNYESLNRKTEKQFIFSTKRKWGRIRSIFLFRKPHNYQADNNWATYKIKTNMFNTSFKAIKIDEPMGTLQYGTLNISA